MVPIRLLIKPGGAQIQAAINEERPVREGRMKPCRPMTTDL
jgi:hypothetical protein